MEQIRKCSKCKKNYDLEHYTKGNKILNTCLKCRTFDKKYKNKNKCIHSKQKDKCKECSGVGICPHNKQKPSCKLCGNPIHITILNMISSSKQKDKKINIYDESEFIDYEYLFNLIDISNDECYYCECQLQYINFTNNLATIERLDNDIGHNKKNVVISCRTCNYSKIGSR